MFNRLNECIGVVIVFCVLMCSISLRMVGFL